MKTLGRRRSYSAKVRRRAGALIWSGSLADLPYVLAEVEQDFIVPENVQALIWQ